MSDTMHNAQMATLALPHQMGMTPQLPPQRRHLYPLPIKWVQLPGPSNRHEAPMAPPALPLGTPCQMGFMPTLPSIKQPRRPNGRHNCSSSNGHDAITAALALPLTPPTLSNQLATQMATSAVPN